jgi:NitT/TauT family transport system substrate-binding protein
MLANRVEAAVLSEPFVSFVLRQDSSFHLLADLNNPGNDALGFAQTAVVFHPSLLDKRVDIDRLLQETCDFSVQYPERVIEILEEKGLFKKGMLTKESIIRSKINYISAQEATEEIHSFLQLIQLYEPKALGGFIPDEAFISGKP